MHNSDKIKPQPLLRSILKNKKLKTKKAANMATFCRFQF
ncbi:hypothetical protein PLIP_a0918 [Pseudoalteromonas lipolytica LMEB 39]|nr:hypothetical protein [Pseudoalteromonas lipolytica LMEB 39]